MNRRALPILVLLIIVAAPIFAADLSVPDFELISRGYMSGGSFKLATHGAMDLQIGGGYKFNGQILFSFTGDNIGDLSTLANTHLTFKGASITVNDLFSSPLALTYFTGYNETFGNGDAFPTYFDTPPIASRFRGYYYFPTGIQYDGIYTVAGTGIKLSLPHLTKWFDSELFVYQDANLGAGHYASDFRTLLNFKHFKFEGFVGGSFPESTAGIYRAGALLYYDPGSTGQFLTEIGIPRWDPIHDSFNIGLFYLLFEPRVTFGSFSIIPTLFWHPAYYNEVATNQVPTANINVNFQFGNPAKSTLIGGMETELDYSTTSASQFTALVSPYLRLVAAGVIWKLKVNVNLYPFVISKIADGYFGVQTQF